MTTDTNIKATDTEIARASANPSCAERDLHDFPAGHGGQPCPFGFSHKPTYLPGEWPALRDS